MSNTYKTKPWRVLEREALKAGYVDHDHTYLGIGRDNSYVRDHSIVIYSTFYESFDEYEETVEYYKRELRSLDLKYSLVEKIDTYPILETVEYEVDDDTLSEYEFYGYHVQTGVDKVFCTTFTVPVLREVKITKYCTTYEFFDNSGFFPIDTRDGGRAMCSPDVHYFLKGRDSRFFCDCCDFSNSPSPTKRSANLKNIAKAFNSGESLDSLEDYEVNDLYF